jgi:hypothetical protein
MNCSLPTIRWLRVLGAALAVIALSFLILTLITTVYAFGLAFEARGSPDQAAISQFAARLSRWLMPLLEALLTTLAAGVVARITSKAGVLHGLLVGILAGLSGLAMTLAFGGRLNLQILGLFLATVGCGWLGGFIGRKRGE